MINKFVIAGADGYIGQRIVKTIHESQRMILLSPVQREYYIHLDLLDVQRFNFGLINPFDKVILLAGISSPDLCSSDFKRSFEINVIGTVRFISECLRKRARVLFLSSDTVYGASSKENDEDVIPHCPAGEYGIMKWIVEKYFTGDPGFKSFRLSYVFSWNDKFTLYLRNCLTRKQTAEIFHPFIRRAVYIQDLVTCVTNLFSCWDLYDNQFFNICGPQYVSRLDIAESFCRNVGEVGLNLVTPGEEFYRVRPAAIKITSKYSDSLLGKEFTTIDNAFQIEEQYFLKKAVWKTR